MTTINISLSKSMYEDTKKMLAKKRYVSISELIRDALRKLLYPNITENGFLPEFEEVVLRSAAEPEENDTILETSEDAKNYFLYLKKPSSKKMHDKS